MEAASQGKGGEPTEGRQARLKALGAGVAAIFKFLRHYFQWVQLNQGADEEWSLLDRFDGDAKTAAAKHKKGPRRRSSKGSRELGENAEQFGKAEEGKKGRELGENAEQFGKARRARRPRCPCSLGIQRSWPWTRRTSLV